MHDAALPALRRPSPIPPAGAAEFDAWLRRHIQHLHADILAEPVPDRFLRLLDGLPDGPAG